MPDKCLTHTTILKTKTHLPLCPCWGKVLHHVQEAKDHHQLYSPYFGFFLQQPCYVAARMPEKWSHRKLTSNFSCTFHIEYTRNRKINYIIFFQQRDEENKEQKILLSLKVQETSLIARIDSIKVLNKNIVSTYALKQSKGVSPDLVPTSSRSYHGLKQQHSFLQVSNLLC